MNFPALHSWKLEPRQAIALQKELAGLVETENRLPPTIQTVAGVDVSYEKWGQEFFAGVVVLSFPDLVPVEEASARGQVDFPYIPGLLSFRELPVLLEAFRALETTPDVILVDGQGIAHPRRLGIASHLGLWLDIPTIGCAKSRLCGSHAEPGAEKGKRAPLMEKEETIGSVLRSRDQVRPLFVSPGHRMSVPMAAELALACCTRYRLPEPTRMAHHLTNRLRRSATP